MRVCQPLRFKYQWTSEWNGLMVPGDSKFDQPARKGGGIRRCGIGDGVQDGSETGYSVRRKRNQDTYARLIGTDHGWGDVVCPRPGPAV